jgi:TrmH RNA methyltransferase
VGVEVVYGLRAGLAVLSQRPADVLEVYFAPAVADEIRPLLEGAATRGVPVASLPDRQLEKAANAAHHEGLCLLVRARRWTSAASIADLLASRRGTAVALDRVRNPYNVGSILRSAAFFGVDAAVLGSPLPQQALANDAVRVAEGGTEHLALVRTTDLAETLARFRVRGVHVIGADAHAPDLKPGSGASVRDAIRATAFRRPAVIVVGHEREGLSARVRAACDELVAIAGTGAIDSLNVAVAAGILMEKLAGA